MGLLDLFRPKWRHSRVDVRRAAIAALGEHQREALAWVARNDPEAELRRSVLDRIDDAPLLAERAATDPDPAVAAAARARLNQVVGGPSFADKPAARAAPAPKAAPPPKAAPAPKAAPPPKAAPAPKAAQPPKAAPAPKVASAPKGRANKPYKASKRPEPAPPPVGEVLSVEEAERRYGALLAPPAPPAAPTRPAPPPPVAAVPAPVVTPAPVEPAPVEAAPAPVPAETPAPPPAPRPRREDRGDRARERAAARDQERAYVAWAVLPRFQELLGRADAALAVESADAKLLLRLKRELIEEWTALGPPPREQAEALRAAFGERLDRLTERGRAGQAALEQERQENLGRKTSVVTRLEALASAADLKAATTELGALQAEWRAVGPLPRAEQDALNARYKAALDAFYARKKAAHAERSAADGERLAALRRLVEQAEALTQAADPIAAAERAKSLQAQWKTLGRAGTREEMDALWARLRAASDAVFARRNAAEDAALEANATRKEALIARAMALAEEGEVADVDATVRTLMNEWKKIGHAPRARADQLWGEFRAALDRIRNPPPLDPALMGKSEQSLAFKPFAELKRRE